MKEKILWAVRVGNEDWQEEIITINASLHEKATEWAKANGFHKFRVSYNDSSVPPDFTKVLR